MSEPFVPPNTSAPDRNVSRAPWWNSLFLKPEGMPRTLIGLSSSSKTMIPLSVATQVVCLKPRDRPKNLRERSVLITRADVTLVACWFNFRRSSSPSRLAAIRVEELTASRSIIVLLGLGEKRYSSHLPIECPFSQMTSTDRSVDKTRVLVPGIRRMLVIGDSNSDSAIKRETAGVLSTLISKSCPLLVVASNLLLVAIKAVIPWSVRATRLGCETLRCGEHSFITPLANVPQYTQLPTSAIAVTERSLTGPG